MIINLNEGFDTIKQEVGDYLKDEQINEIIEKCKSKGIETIEFDICDDPFEFEKKIRKQVEGHSLYHKEFSNKKNTDVLIGNLSPGELRIYKIDKFIDKYYEMTDFSINEIQVARTWNEESEGRENEDEYQDIKNQKIYIYLPNEMNITKTKSFKQIVLEKYNMELFKAIKEKIGDKLSEEQIKVIVEKSLIEEVHDITGEKKGTRVGRRVFRKLSLNEDIFPKIEITSNPYNFEQNTRQTEYWGGDYEDEVVTHDIETQVLMGDYKPGKEYIHEGNIYSQQDEDFSINQIQTAFITDIESNSSYMDSNYKIQIYIPDEKEFPEDLTFKQLKERNNPKLVKKEPMKTEEIEAKVEKGNSIDLFEMLKDNSNQINVIMDIIMDKADFFTLDALFESFIDTVKEDVHIVDQKERMIASQCLAIMRTKLNNKDLNSFIKDREKQKSDNKSKIDEFISENKEKKIDKQSVNREVGNNQKDNTVLTQSEESPALINEAKYTQIYNEAKGKIQEVLSKIKTFIYGKSQRNNDQDNINR